MTPNSSCGACDGWMKWFKPPHHKFFQDECTVHDYLYEIGGTKEQRLEADKLLFFQMVRKSVGYFEDRKVVSLVWFVLLSYVYYLGVRVMGKSRFNYH